MQINIRDRTTSQVPMGGLPDMGQPVHGLDGPWGCTIDTVIFDHECTPNILYIFSCNFSLEEIYRHSSDNIAIKQHFQLSILYSLIIWDN